jgi:hypothetical protein
MNISVDTTTYVEQMAAIERSFAEATGLADRGYYKIFYSHIHRFPLLLLGMNPGGTPGAADLFSASNSYCENWEHDFVRFRKEPRYKLAAPVFSFLCQALGTDEVNSIRQIPATNIGFRRSQNTDGIDPATLAREASATLKRLLVIVDPAVVLFLSKGAFDKFQEFHCENAADRCDDCVFTPNGRYPAEIYTHCTATLACTGKRIRLVSVGHPSKYAGRSEWPRVVERVRRELQLHCEKMPLLQTLPDLPDHR